MAEHTTNAVPRPDDAAESVPYRVPVGGVLYAVMASPFIWMGHLSLGPALAGYQCSRNTTWPINALTLASMLAIVAAIALGWRIHRAAVAAGPSITAQAVRFAMVVGMLWSAISLLATVLEGVPNVVGVASCPR